MARRPRADPDAPAESADQAAHRVECHLDAVLTEHGMTLTELATRAGVTVVNLSVLKNDRARAVRFSTLTAVCDVLRCQPGDLFSVLPVAAVSAEPDDLSVTEFGAVATAGPPTLPPPATRWPQP